MDKAKASIKDFMHKSGHNDTTVHETVAPGVQHEAIKPHQHEEVSTAIDKEIHQDHYHRTVQPIQDREVLPEKHSHNMSDVQHREFDHRDHDTTKRHLAAEQSGFKDERTVHDTTHSQSAAPTIAGEHKHHHIHETIQPVVHKETIQPNVVHTTVPVHEVHHNTAKHHNVSELPPVSMSDFKQKGGVLGGREERYDGFEGEPKNIGGAPSGMKSDSRHDGHQKHDSHHTDNPTSGLTGNNSMTGGNDRRADEHGLQGERSHLNKNEAPVGSNYNQTGSTENKPSILQKLNPFADADGDGKKGLMD